MPLGIGNSGTKGSPAAVGTLTNGGSSLTATRIPVASGGTTLVDDAGFTYNTTTNALAIPGATTITGSSDSTQLSVVGNATQTNTIGQIASSTASYGMQVRGSVDASNKAWNNFCVGSIASDAASKFFWYAGSPVSQYMASTAQLAWSSGADATNPTADAYLSRGGVALISTVAADGSTGPTDIQIAPAILTAGMLTQTNKAYVRSVIHRYDWTNAMVTALGATTAGDLTVCTLPAKTVVTNAYVVITGAEGSLTSLTVALGRVGATYLDYIVASNAKAAANTVYGDASAERGTNLTGYDLPSFTGTTAVKLHFISGVENLSTATASTGTVYLETMLLP